VKPVVAGKMNHNWKHQSAPMGLFAELAARNCLMNKKYSQLLYQSVVRCVRKVIIPKFEEDKPILPSYIYAY
jgi:hypothetical protein